MGTCTFFRAQNLGSAWEEALQCLQERPRLASPLPLAPVQLSQSTLSSAVPPREVLPHLHPGGAGGDALSSISQRPAQALTAPPMKKCYDSTATTSRLPWGPAWCPGLVSGTPLDDISGERPTSQANKPQLPVSPLTALCLSGTPGTAWAR